jgi:hypothetical protein
MADYWVNFAFTIYMYQYYIFRYITQFVPNTLLYCISDFTVEFLKEEHSAPTQFYIYFVFRTVHFQ